MGFLILETSAGRVILGDENDVENAKKYLGEPYRDVLTGKLIDPRAGAKHDR